MFVVYWKWKVWNNVKQLLDFLNIESILMDDSDFDENLLENSDKIIASPGIKLNHNIYKNFAGKIISEMLFLADIIKKYDLQKKLDFVAITWTNGKSTVSHVLYNIFVWLEINKEVILWWNFGTPLSNIILEILENKTDKNHLIVLEMSSFMLYNLENFVFDYSILLNIWLDHVDWHQTFDNYKESKLNIFKNTKKTWFYHKSLQSEIDNIGVIPCKLESYDDTFDLSKSIFVWDYNKWNLQAVYDITKKYFQNTYWSFDESKFFEVLKDIAPLEHRMQFVKEIDWVRIYDDWVCSSVHSLSAALGGFDNENVVIIAWWYDKWDNYDLLKDLLKNKVWFCSLIGQTGKKIQTICNELWVENKYFWAEKNSLKLALDKAIEYAKQYNIKIVLFSPGAASFDMFINVYDRCNQFSEIVESL